MYKNDERPNLGQSTDIGHNASPTDERCLMLEQKLSINEAAKVIGISPNSLRKIITEGRLPILKILKKTLILASDVEKLLKDSRCFIKATEQTDRRLPPLPSEVINSPYLRIGGKK